MRQVVLDTETTGLDPQQGHRIIEIGCVEIDNRRLTGKHFQCYVNPEREVDEGAFEVHGLSNEFLADKPRFSQVVDEFLNFVKGAELVIHNAAFDMGFLNSELAKLEPKQVKLETHCQVLDTLALARAKHPGQRNNLDALCKRYGIDNTHRSLHGALLDAEILADVYLLMTSGQSSLLLKDEDNTEQLRQGIKRIDSNRPALAVISASEQELNDHGERLASIEKTSESGCFWLELEK
ncbi:MAG: DNA polymerase III subunit epsilon [SAR86 cluster bacterium]|uniref:DNA polymerase III subunit epsilon n=1 Tax=SAR86 cluster bacterium TaxID=2030880 RepID=A0A2A4MVP5_9GAMM|nr:MAG: DNA polymerase III subunit epsilon [SAR86 cluster bacterium]